MTRLLQRGAAKTIVVAGAVAVTVAIGGFASASVGTRPGRPEPAVADRATVRQVVAIAGSNRFLIYLKYSVTDGKRARSGKLYELTSTGVVRRLGTVRRTNDSNLQREFSLSGRYLNYNTRDARHFRLWDLVTGKEHDPTPPAGTIQIAAAPRGYLVATQRKSGPGLRELETVSLSGTVKPLAEPFPHGKLYGVQVTARRYVAYNSAQRPWGVKTGTFANPGHTTTLLGRHGRSSGQASCGIPNSQYVACTVDSHHWRLQMYRLDGHLVAHTNKIYANDHSVPLVIDGTTVWLTRAPRLHLRQLTTSGTVTHSTQTFASDGPIRAFHRIIAGAHGRTALLEMKSAISKPAVLVNAEGSK